MSLKSNQTGQLQKSDMSNCPVFTPVKNLDKILEDLRIDEQIKTKPLPLDSGFMNLYLLKFLAGDKNTSSGFADCSIDGLYLWEVARLGSNRFVKRVCSASSRFALALDELSKLSKLTICDLTVINTSLRPKKQIYGIRKNSMRAGNPKTNPYAFYCVPPQLVKEYLTGLIEFIHSNNIDDINKALLVFQQFIFIHPFRDGNGRVSRLLLLKLLQNKYGLIYAALLSIYLKNINRDNFHKAMYLYRNNNIKALKQFYNQAIHWTNQAAKVLYDLVDAYLQLVGKEKVESNVKYSQIIVKTSEDLDVSIFQFNSKKANKNIYTNTALLNVLNQFDYYLRYELRKHQ